MYRGNKVLLWINDSSLPLNPGVKWWTHNRLNDILHMFVFKWTAFGDLFITCGISFAAFVVVLYFAL